VKLRALLFILAGLPLIAVSPVKAGDDPHAVIPSSGHVIMVRHALAPGSGDPKNFRIGDCSTQRNLDVRGRVQAGAVGRWLRSNGISSARIYSSQWCRCLETARLMDLGPVEELAALNSFYERPQDREPNLSALRTFLSKQPRNSHLIVLVTHYVTIAGLTGEAVSSGEGVLLKLAGDGGVTVVRRLNFGL